MKPVSVEELIFADHMVLKDESEKILQQNVRIYHEDKHGNKYG